MFTCYLSCQHKRNVNSNNNKQHHPFPNAQRPHAPSLPANARGLWWCIKRSEAQHLGTFVKKNQPQKWAREILKPPPGQKEIFVGFLSKWRDWIRKTQKLEIAKDCGCWALRRCCFQSITFWQLQISWLAWEYQCLCHQILKTAIDWAPFLFF